MPDPQTPPPPLSPQKANTQKKELSPVAQPRVIPTGFLHIVQKANKGILVTTADYGPDAHEFARGKPITLLSGSELLYLLEKHGHKSRIDLKEAKQILKTKGH